MKNAGQRRKKCSALVDTSIGIFTSKSFKSIVVDKDDHERHLVRALCKGDIEELFPDAEVFQDPNADYRYRVFLSAAYIAKRISEYIIDALECGRYCWDYRERK